MLPRLWIRYYFAHQAGNRPVNAGDVRYKSPGSRAPRYWLVGSMRKTVWSASIKPDKCPPCKPTGSSGSAHRKITPARINLSQCLTVSWGDSRLFTSHRIVVRYRLTQKAEGCKLTYGTSWKRCHNCRRGSNPGYGPGHGLKRGGEHEKRSTDRSRSGPGYAGLGYGAGQADGLDALRGP